MNTTRYHTNSRPNLLLTDEDNHETDRRFHDRYQPAGTEDTKTAHAKGLWHRTLSALAIDSTVRRVMLHKKAPSRYTVDRTDYADITVGGHYQAGEAIPDVQARTIAERALATSASSLSR